MIRVLVIAFNVAVVTFLVYRMIRVAQQPISANKKLLVMIVGILLLLAPLWIFVGLVRPNFQYFLLYPVAVSLYLFLIRQL